MSASVDLRSLVTRHVHCSTRVFHHAYVTATKLDNCNIIVNWPSTDHSPSSLINLPKFSKLLHFAQKLFNYFSMKRYLTLIVTIRFLSDFYRKILNPRRKNNSFFKYLAISIDIVISSRQKFLHKNSWSFLNERYLISIDIVIFSRQSFYAKIFNHSSMISNFYRYYNLFEAKIPNERSWSFLNERHLIFIDIVIFSKQKFLHFKNSWSFLNEKSTTHFPDSSSAFISSHIPFHNRGKNYSSIKGETDSKMIVNWRSLGWSGRIKYHTV